MNTSELKQRVYAAIDRGGERKPDRYEEGQQHRAHHAPLPCGRKGAGGRASMRPS